MKSLLLSLCLFSGIVAASANTADTSFITPFERSGGKQTATYGEVQDFYKQLYIKYPSCVMMGEMGITDIGLPLRSIFYSKSGDFKKDNWKREGKIVILINNGIHSGEPDGVDACMMLIRDAAMGKIEIPDNIILVVIPLYNIGGALNRSSTSRANQNGPESYGFRGNSRNLDLNRDFIKCDAAETSDLEEQFARVNPDIFIDNHVSDGADYQYTMTLLSTQEDKLGGAVGTYMRDTLTPLLFQDMKERGYEMTPYVNDFDKTPDKGWREFYESPRFSSGYAALFQIFAYVPETHMLKPFKDRVRATYALMQSFIKAGSAHAKEIKQARANDREALMAKKEFALEWRVDTTHADSFLFKGYEGAYKKSEVSGLPRLYYDHKKPYTKQVAYFDHYIPSKTVTAPSAYVIPKTWVPVITRLRNNGVHIERFRNDTTLSVTAYHIDNYETVQKPYENHYLHKNVQVTPNKTTMKFFEGDYIIWLNQSSKRYLVETLEPTAPDAFFAWNFFDGILQQKEYFSDYVFEDVAAKLLKDDPALKAELEEKRKQDPDFANNGAAQLDFVYRHSAYMEPGYLRYPVYRLE
jgi:Zinc carboxypeptidase